MNFGINGFGRIGRMLFRIAFKNSNNMCTYINEPNAQLDDIIYFLRYDSIYGTFQADINKINENTIKVSSKKKEWCVHFTSVTSTKTLLKEYVKDISILIDSTGSNENIDYYSSNEKNLPCKIIVTASNDKIKHEVVFGVNELKKNYSKWKLYSSSICDVVAIAPVLRSFYEKYKIKNTIITTLHPVLNYQKVIDNYTQSNVNRSLGRQYTHSLIPKNTSAEKTLNKLLQTENIICFSYRVSNDAVCSADISIIFDDCSINQEEIYNDILSLNNEIIAFSSDDLVSIDFKANPFSAILDMRWIRINDNILKLVIWYDNEYGYVSRLNDLISKFSNEEK